MTLLDMAEFEENAYAAIPDEVIRHPDLSSGAICHYGNLLLYASQDGKCWPGQERLADDMRVSVRQIHTYNKELEAAKLIEVERRGMGQTNLYSFPPGLIAPPETGKTKKPI